MERNPEPSAEVKLAFRQAMRAVASTVTVITASDTRLSHGMTATAVTSLSMDPPSLVICLNNGTLLREVFLTARRFCVNVLRCGQSNVSAAFAGGMPPEERFNVGTWARTEDGTLYLTDAQANLFCRKAAAIPYGTHTIFVGEVESLNIRSTNEPLIYHNSNYCTSIPEPMADALARRSESNGAAT
jgi:flavin reductase (DIM6/NTAB) family NADH-FMN oxidoreductase RutF